MNATETIPATQRTITSLRAYPQSWYLVARSKHLRPAGILSLDFLGHSIVLFRTRTNSIHALDAHCAHMGAHLGKGQVIEDCLRCPLHHWTYDTTGQCAAMPNSKGQRTWPVEERFGNIFIFNGPRPLFPLPSFESTGDTLRTKIGRPVTIRCPWVAVVANAFDMQHLNVVHGRALIEEPIVEQPDSHRLRLRYRSRVTGKSLADMLTKWLSKNEINVTITCWGGTILTVESQVGRAKTTMFLGIMPGDNSVTATPIFGTQKSRFPGWDWLKVRITAWLFSHFMQKDVSIVEDMRFKVVMNDLPVGSPLRLFLDFLDHLPAEDGGKNVPRGTFC